MPILVSTAVAPPTLEEVHALITAAITAERERFLRSAVPNYLDPVTRKPVSYSTAIRRGLTGYDYVAVNGPLDKRVAVLEGLVKTDDAEDAAEAVEQDQIRAALQKPILG